MTRTRGMPVGDEVRERLRAAQQAESAAIAAVQKAQAAEADARGRLDEILVRHREELTKTARAVHAAQATLVRTSGIERAATLLDVSPKVLKSAAKETTQDTKIQTTRAHANGRSGVCGQDASNHATRSKTPAATTPPTIAPTET